MVTCSAIIKYPEPALGAFPHGTVYFLAVEHERPVNPDVLLPVLTANGCLVLDSGHMMDHSMHMFKLATYADPELLCVWLHKALGDLVGKMSLAETYEDAVRCLFSLRESYARRDAIHDQYLKDRDGA